MTEETDWAGVVTGTRANDCELTIRTVTIDRAPQGGSQPAQVLADDGCLYWIKPIGNPQGNRVPVNEQVVARCGHLIGAPMCEVALLRIPPELHGHRLSGNTTLSEGITHGSCDVKSAMHSQRLEHPTEDENARRQAFIYALFDWCWGNDAQWLYDAEADMQIFSHDHGHYFPDGPNWSVDKLRQLVDTEHPLQLPADNVSSAALGEAADNLENLDPESIAAVLRKIPSSWPIVDEELETLGFFLNRRRSGVAQRLREIAS